MSVARGYLLQQSTRGATSEAVAAPAVVLHAGADGCCLNHAMPGAWFVAVQMPFSVAVYATA